MANEHPHRRSGPAFRFSLRRLFRLVTCVGLGTALCAMVRWELSLCAFFVLVLVFTYYRRQLDYWAGVAMAVGIWICVIWCLLPVIH
ncbi:MAG: hypothetical protein AAF961_02080 [Planctomycetota bacterium]